jgi:hypothetical protein
MNAYIIRKAVFVCKFLTFLQYVCKNRAKNAIGGENKDDPFSKLNEEILIETVTTGCIIAQIYKQVYVYIYV